MKISLKAFGGYTPDRIVTNDDLAKWVDTSDDWITSRSGIRRRHLSTGENTSDLCAQAARAVLANAGASPLDVDILIVATATPDYGLPSTACLVQAKIGAANAFAFDLNAACSGFMYGLGVAEKMLRSGKYATALVLGGDTLSKITDWQDRGTCVLFGDGAGGVLLARGGREAFLAEDFHSDGRQAGTLTAGPAPVANPLTQPGPAASPYIQMDGRAIWEFAVSQVPESVLAVLAKAGRTQGDITYVVPHQANYRIIKQIAAKLNMSMEKFYVNIQDYGNTSSASIPLCLAEMAGKGLLAPGSGDLVILTGFGAGITWGTMLLEL
jgi:3-oxoacyl-[acyl-carrier-protein] synthase-3